MIYTVQSTGWYQLNPSCSVQITPIHSDLFTLTFDHLKLVSHNVRIFTQTEVFVALISCFNAFTVYIM